MSNTTDKNFLTMVISVAVIAISGIAAIAVFNVNDRILMSKNIDSAIAKGMDPLSVRCSFAQSSDTICIAYAASRR